MKLFLLSFASSISAMLAIDSVWLRSMNARFYEPNIGHLLAENVKYGPAAAFYVVYGIGLTLLVLLPALEAGSSLARVFLFGAVYGLIAYGTYDLTNHATLRDWPLIVTAVEMAWGAVLTGAISVVSNVVTRHLG